MAENIINKNLELAIRIKYKKLKIKKSVLKNQILEIKKITGEFRMISRTIRSLNNDDNIQEEMARRFENIKD